MTVESIYKELRKESLPIYVWGAGIFSVRVCECLEKAGIAICGRFVDIPISQCKIEKSSHKVLELKDVLNQNTDIVVVCGHAHFENIAKLKAYNQIKNIYAIVNPYTYYQGVGEQYLVEHKEQFNRVCEVLNDEISIKALNGYFTINDTNNYDVLLQENFLVSNMFNFPNMQFSENEIFLDGGAYVGDTVQQFIAHTNGKYKQIYAVEPNPYSFAKLQETVKDLEKVECLQMGMGKENGILKMGREDCESSFLSADIGDSNISVEVRTLDDLFYTPPHHQNRQCPTIIKILVPYMDFDILKGAEKMIKEHKPKLIVNIGIGDGSHIFDIIEFIHQTNPDYKIALKYDMPTPVRLFMFCF